VRFPLDTNVISEWVKPQPNPRVVAWLKEVDEEQVFLSVGSLAEIRRGKICPSCASESRCRSTVSLRVPIRAWTIRSGSAACAGLVDEMEINLVPTLLGSGERLFEGVGDDLHGLELVRTAATPKVIHLKFARR
jgi:hypothetical protein